MATWQTNLINNLLVAFILLSIFVIAYCKIKNVTAIELIKSIKEAFSPTDE